MKQATRSWVEKAEGHHRLARQSLATTEPVVDDICWLAHQCIEKYLKAYLEEHEVRFPRTHDLAVLTDLIGEGMPLTSEIQDDLESLSAYAVDIRYPGFSADRDDADDAMRIATEIRDLVRAALGLQR